MVPGTRDPALSLGLCTPKYRSWGCCTEGVVPVHGRPQGLPTWVALCLRLRHARLGVCSPT